MYLNCSMNFYLVQKLTTVGFKQLVRQEKDTRIDGKYVSRIRFAYDIVLVSHTSQQLQEMLTEKKQVHLNMYSQKRVVIESITIERVNENVYLCHLSSLGKQNCRSCTNSTKDSDGSRASWAFERGFRRNTQPTIEQILGVSQDRLHTF